MKKIFIYLLLFVVILNAQEFLQPKEAFNSGVTTSKDNITFNLHLDKTIYVYDEFLKVSIVKPKNIDITKELSIKEPINHDDFLVHLNDLSINVPIKLIKEKIGAVPFELKFDYQGCSMAGLCYSPMSLSYTSNNINSIEKAVPKDDKIKQPKNETDSITQTLKDGNILLILATFFGFGVLLALTPCVFPMIPILSSIIVRQSSKNEKMSASKGFILSLVYVLSMSVAYTLAGVLAGLFGANIQAMLQNPYVIVSFAAIFVALAFSMFGYYEIGLPSSWMSKINKASDNSSRHGGFISVTIMGFLSALIVGPCVAPPLAGALVYIGQTGDALLGGAALFVMSIGMGLPLLAVGIGAGKYMPKPGGWMSTVSKVFGVVMLAVAIWMLDRVVPFVVTYLLSVSLLMGSALYLIKKGNRFGKIVAAILMIISVVFTMKTVNSKDEVKLQYLHIDNTAQLKHIVAHSKKPVMLDFWATWCVSCKEFDNITFKDPTVLNELKKYNLVRVDVTKNTKEQQELMKMFNLFGPPAIIFYENGIEDKSKRIVGYKNPKEFMEIVK